MKTYRILLAVITTFFIASCNSSDDDPATPSGSGNESVFIPNIQNVWTDSLNPAHKVFFGQPDSVGKFIGSDPSGTGNANLFGSVRNFDIQYTVLTLSGYTDYKGKLTDTTTTQMRMHVTTLTDTLFLYQ